MKADYKNMILSNQKLFDFLNQEFNILPTESDMTEIKIICKQIESESLQPFDRNNWCVDIRAEKDSPLLERFKEWFLKGYRKQTDYDYKYWFIDNGGKTRGSVLGDIPIYTLSELSRLMPEIWGDSFYCKTFTVENKTSGTIEAQPTSSENWEPEWGKEYEFSQDQITWRKYRYVGLNPINTSLGNDFVTIDHIGRLKGFKYIRPVKTLRDDIAELVGLAVGHASVCWNPRPGNLVFDSTEATKAVDECVTKILALIEQRRGN